MDDNINVQVAWHIPWCLKSVPVPAAELFNFTFSVTSLREENSKLDLSSRFPDSLPFVSILIKYLSVMG